MPHRLVPDSRRPVARAAMARRPVAAVSVLGLVARRAAIGRRAMAAVSVLGLVARRAAIGRRAMAAVAALALVAGLALPGTGAVAAGPAMRKAAVNSALAPSVPCPIAKAVPPIAAPKKLPDLPLPPARRADAPVVGGAALASTGLLVPAGAPALPASLNARAWVIADLDSGAILGACAPHAFHAPASTQKLLTILVALSKLDPKQIVTVTEEDLAFEPGSSAVGLVKGGRYTVETIVLGLLLASGNDAANVVARLAGGTGGVAGTIKAMNEEARRIGALDTKAVTPSGLDGPGQYTSAYDLALIARADFASPEFRRYNATQRTVIPAQLPKFKAFQIQNDNRLLTEYPGAIGGKTGFTDFARHTYVGAAERGGRRLVVTMLRGEVRPQRPWQQAAALLDWGFALPAQTEPVGRLVSPGEADKIVAAAPDGDAPPVAKQAAERSSSGFGTADLAGALLVLATLGLGTWWVIQVGRRSLARRRRY